jgi:CheY-like chemotaxis protein
VLDLNAVVEDTVSMLRRMIGEDVRLAVVQAYGLWPVKADPGQIEQVLLNLAVNARDAMPTGGRLTVETANVDLDEGYARSRPDARPGPHVLLSVSDTGRGMTPEVRARIFEPFFTTKGAGKGTGLGLATVYGIVKQSGGHVEVRSGAGAGTTFQVYLPAAGTEAREAQARSAAYPPPRGTETVLLVEDEDAIRVLARHVLAGCGYAVLEAADGDEAARVAGGHAGPVHLVVCDVVMPGVGGRVVAERVAATHPGVRVLFVSGYTDDAVVRHGVLHEKVNFLQKPFSPTALAHKVREVLDGPTGA